MPSVVTPPDLFIPEHEQKKNTPIFRTVGDKITLQATVKCTTTAVVLTHCPGRRLRA
jgi:uncharacterized protein YcsI (UPF0317 family)